MSPLNRRDFLKTTIAASAVVSVGTLPLHATRRTATDIVTLGNSGMNVTRLAFGTGSKRACADDNDVLGDGMGGGAVPLRTVRLGDSAVVFKAETVDRRTCRRGGGVVFLFVNWTRNKG